MRLVQIRGKRPGEAHLLSGHQTIGRSNTNNIVVDDQFASRDQAVIHVDGQSATLITRDLASPVFVNGHRVDNCSMRPGDVLQVGRTQYVLEGDRPQYQPRRADIPPQQYQSTANYALQQPYPLGVQQINMVQQNNNAGLWIILALVFAGPLMCIGLLAAALLPYTMMLSGAIICIWGCVEYNRLNGRQDIQAKTWAKIWGGASLAVLGLIMAITFIALRNTAPSASAESNPPIYSK